MYARDLSIASYGGANTLELVRPDPIFATTTIQWISNPDVTQYLGADFTGATVDDERAHLEQMIDDTDKYSWMIALDSEIIGNIELNEIPQLSEKYGVRAGAFCTVIGDPANWGKGIGKYAKQAACNWAFTEGGFELIEAKAYVQNERSWRGLESLGYHYVGIERGDVNGEPVEWKVYMLRKSEWEKLDWSTHRFSQKYTIVQFLEVVENGYEYKSNNWPLHATIVDTFAIDWSVDEMNTQLAVALKHHPIAESTAEGESYLGENGQTQVVLLGKSQSLLQLHHDVLSVPGEGGLRLNDSHFAFGGFLPHSTIQKHARLNKGDRVRFTALSIIDMFPGNDPYLRKVLRTIKISDETPQTIRDLR